MSASVAREQLRRDLSAALAAIQRDCDVTNLDVLAARLREADLAPLPFHGRMILKELEPVPRNYSALMWHLVQVIAKLEKDPDDPRGGDRAAALGGPMKMANLDRLKRMLADDLKALREGKGVLGVAEMADAIEMVGPEYSINARGIPRGPA